MKNCNQPIPRHIIEETLLKLENQGKIIFIGNGSWITTKHIIKKALKNKNIIDLPSDLIGEIISFLIKHPELGYTNLKEFIRDAVRYYISNRKK